ncbi:hypothetical protein AM571_PC01101 (plasmid) [Rhizobium etli 8C-3]|uniref:Uncharacterized protein n=1 Tax=Rhizobium etli 8C-3 TaxID=538025 RepID=A0A1L5PFV6_RHIET|nr:hypothetical protein AM571_PC01101 [Rhizobium etli 8C-3]
MNPKPHLASASEFLFDFDQGPRREKSAKARGPGEPLRHSFGEASPATFPFPEKFDN